MWRCVDLALTDVSVEGIASNFRVEKSESFEPASAGGCRLSHRRPNISQLEDNPDSVSFLPYVGDIFNRISRVLFLHDIKSMGLAPKKIFSLLRPVKDNLGLKTPRVYRIP
jgi:hypothetical protein